MFKECYADNLLREINTFKNLLPPNSITDISISGQEGGWIAVIKYN